MAQAQQAPDKPLGKEHTDSLQPASQQPKTADRPHRITIVLGLLSPLLALVSLGVSFYVFRDSQRSMHVAQSGYLGFHFESAEVGPEAVPATGDNKPFRVEARVSVRNIGNTPVYIDSVKKELYAIDADNIWDHIGGSHETSPNYDPLGPKAEPLFLEYNSGFTAQELTGDRSVVYRIEVQWHDAFGETQKPSVFCGILTNVTLPIRGKRVLSSIPCMKGFTESSGSAR